MQQISRLLDTFIPEHYALSLTLKREERTFEGIVTIIGSSTDDNGQLFLHAKDLTISQVIVDGKAATHTTSDDTVKISHEATIENRTHTVVVTFSGTITDSMHGLYPSYYQHNGVKKELLATQFESHHAREVFPCIDEPSAKATFDLTLTTETDVIVLGNMPVASQRTEGDNLVTSFERSPRMSTYLLAWVVGELHKKSTTTEHGVEVNVWATPAQTLESLDFALSIASRTIDFFDEYYGTPYPLPKSDHVALPDFSSGAMENWGLITYREVALLADPATASIDNKQTVALVVAHELSHQWFGNLVTMKWWNDLWLNESFANMMEYVAIDALEPTWQVWLDHASYEVIQALRRDSLDGVQAIQTDVHHPDEINSLFDPSIVYAKGGRLLRMLQAYIGNEALQKGLKVYFATYAYQNTEAVDLWNCLSEASGKDIAGLMEPWIQQSGYPVVTASMQDDTLTLRQEQFFIGEHQPSNKQWPIPLASPITSVPDVMNNQTITVPLKQNTALQLNLDSTAHYIVQYDDNTLQQVLHDLPTATPIDRLKILNEYVLLAQSERIETATILTILDHYKDETSEAVWGVMAIAINELKKFVETDTEAEKALRRYVGALATPQYTRLGWLPKNDEPESDTKLRSLILGMMLYSENDAVIAEAINKYATTKLESLDPNLRTGILSAAVRHSPDKKTVANELLQQHNTTTSSELREDIATALTGTRDTETIRSYLTLIKDGDLIRRQDMTRWLVWLLRNRDGRSLTWEWIREQWNWIEEIFDGDKSYDSYPRYIASILTTSTQLEEYRAFFLPLVTQVALKRNITVGITELTHRVSLLERQGPAVREALLKR